jgi:microcystin-dependent protein
MNYWLGTILLLPYDFTPRGFAPCEGQLLPISGNQALYSLIGNKFGGDGRTNFALPDYRADAPKGSTYVIAIQGVVFNDHGY